MKIEYLDVYVDVKKYEWLLDCQKLERVSDYPNLDDLENALEREIGRINVGYNKFLRFILSL